MKLLDADAAPLWMKPGFPMSSLLPQAKKGRSSRSAPLEKCKDILALLGFRPLIKASCGVQSAGAALAASPIGRRIAPGTAPVVATPVVFAPFVPAVVVPRSLRRIPAGLRPGLLLRMLRRLRGPGRLLRLAALLVVLRPVAAVLGGRVVAAAVVPVAAVPAAFLIRACGCSPASGRRRRPRGCRREACCRTP